MSDIIETDKPLKDMNRREKLCLIAQRTGFKPPKTMLTKPIMNSLHAWFTGEFAVDVDRLATGRPTRRELVKRVVVEAINVYRDDPYTVDELDGLLDDPESSATLDEENFAVSLINYYQSNREHETHKGERMGDMVLTAIVKAMDESGDQREWTG